MVRIPHDQSTRSVLNDRWSLVATRDGKLVHQHDQRLGIGEDGARGLCDRQAIERCAVERDRAGHAAILVIGLLHHVKQSLVSIDDALRRSELFRRCQVVGKGLQARRGGPHRPAGHLKRVGNQVLANAILPGDAAAGVAHFVDDEAVGVRLEIQDLGATLLLGDRRACERAEVREADKSDGLLPQLERSEDEGCLVKPKPRRCTNVEGRVKTGKNPPRFKMFV
jgi:hypothetical protein